MVTDYAALIEAFLTKPKAATVDGQSVTNLSPSELKQLLDMLKAEEAAASGDLGIRFQQLKYRR